MKLYRILFLTFCACALISCGGAEERKAVYMEKAMLSIKSGNLDKARIELKNVLQIDPKDGEAYYQLGSVYEQQQDFQKAFVSYLKAEELNPDLLDNQARLGRIYLLLANKPEKAQEKINLILLKEPSHSGGLLLKAAMTLKSGDAEEAITIVKDIINRDINHTDSVKFLASLYLNQKKNDDAIKVLDAAIKNNQNDEKLNKLLALALVANNDYDRAEIIYKDFLERNPDSSAIYNNLAGFYNLTGDKVKAEKILRASIDNDPGNEARILTLIKYIREIKSNDEGIKELKVFIADNEGLGKLRIALAELYVLNGDKQLAIEVFEQAVNDFSKEVTGITARSSLASIYISDKAYDKAIEVVEDAFLVSPNDPKVNHLRAKFAVRDKDFEKAIISLRIVIKEMPENIAAYLLLVNIYQTQGNDAQVESTLNSAYENNNTNADALITLSKYYLASDVKKAEKIIDNYNNIKGTDYEGLSIKAAILNQNRHREEAYEIAEILMETYPDKPNGYLQAIYKFGQKNDIKGAISLIEKGYLSVKDNRKLLVLLTKMQLKEKEFDIVEKRIIAELSSSPEDAELKTMLAEVYMTNNNFDSAETLLNEAVQSASTQENTYLLLSQIYQRKNDLNSVKSILIKGKENIKTSTKIPLKLASLYEAVGSYKDAIGVYQDLYDTQSNNLIVINNLLSMLSDYGNVKDDPVSTNRLIDKLKGSERSVFLDTVGWAYGKLEMHQEAIQYLKQAVEKAPDVNVFNYHLGMAYKMSGDEAQAKIYLEKSLSDNKQFKEKELAEAALKGI